MMKLRVNQVNEMNFLIWRVLEMRGSQTVPILVVNSRTIKISREGSEL
jgi:hypothetical protein